MSAAHDAEGLPRPEYVTDEAGNRYLLEETPLGEGGQGVVYRTRTNPEIAVKLVYGDSSRLRTQLELVRLLGLPDDLHLARPLSMLRDHTGYTMRLLRKMVPISRLLCPPEEEIGPHFVKTGGLRRRLQVLANAARELARLHAVPLVYGDVSPNNVFVSEEVHANEVWLIDADNLQYYTGPSQRVVATPGYGAPEVMRLLLGRSTDDFPRESNGATTLSDSYAFAVLAFEVLAQKHPFRGEALEDGGWTSDGTDDIDERIDAGELPWILDEDDDGNYSEEGIYPRELVLSPRLHELFRRTFVDGRRRPSARPAMLEWAEALQSAADHTLQCRGCKSTFYLQQSCPWCEEGPEPAFIDVASYSWNPEDEGDAFDVKTISRVGRRYFEPIPGSEWIIERRLVRPSSLSNMTEPALKLEITPGGVRLHRLDEGIYHVAMSSTHQLEALHDAKLLPIPAGHRAFYVHCGPLDEPHRVLIFNSIGEAGSWS